MNDAQEALGTAIDAVDNLAHALELPMPAEFHVKQMKVSLPEAVQSLKDCFVALVGENPWE